MEDAHASHGADDSHIGQYNKIIIVLTVLTAIEFGIGYLVKPGVGKEPMVGIGLGIILLCGLAAWKAFLVGKVFMHLKYDPRILGWIAFSPVILGTPLVVIGLYDAIHGGSF